MLSAKVHYSKKAACRPISTIELPELCARLQVGAGVLGLPSAMAYLGWPGGIIVLVLSCECLCLTVLYLHCNSQALCLPFVGIAALIFSCEQPCLTRRSFAHYTPSNPQIRCVAAANLWQPSSLPCLGISSTM